MKWGDRWCNDGSAPTVLVHSDCGTPLMQVTHCPTCDDALDPGQIRSRPGPGAREACDDHHKRRLLDKPYDLLHQPLTEVLSLASSIRDAAHGTQ